MGEYVCDDRMYEPGGLLDQVMHLDDKEFEDFLEKLKAEEDQ